MNLIAHQSVPVGDLATVQVFNLPRVGAAGSSALRQTSLRAEAG
jgi:hypothetical protein